MTDLHTQLQYLYKLERFEKIKPGLTVMRKLLHELGNPQDAFPSIHIAGTNGKGSVAAMLASMLQHVSPLIRGAGGVNIGRYTSPHLIRFNERVTINNRPVTDAALAGLISDVRAAAARAQINPTFFEFTTALAFLHFAHEQVDAAVIEVGMGGDLDATNVITPKLTIITNIGRDHTRWLGVTHHAIAEHKAGIIKPGVPLITAERKTTLLNYFQDICRQKDAPLLPVHQHLKARRISQNLEGQTFVAQQETFTLPLLGRHQIDNALTALLAFSEFVTSPLLKIGKWNSFIIQKEVLIAANAGLKNIRWPGRLQIFSRDPFILLDGAHNPPAVRALARTLDELPLPEPGVLILGSKYDKNIAPILKHIVPRFQKIIVTEANFQPMPAAELTRRIAHFLPLPERNPPVGGKGKKAAAVRIQTIPNPKDALAAAQKELEANKMLLITGSLYLVGDALQALEQS